MKIDLPLLIITLILLSFGTIMVLSSSAYFAARSTHNEFFFIRKHFIRVLIGVALMFFASVIDYRKWKKLSGILIVSSILLLLLCLLYTQTRWLSILSISFQPSEFTKPFLVLFIASYVAKNPERLKELRSGYLPVVAVLGLCVGLVLFQPNFGTSGVLLMSGFLMLFLGGAKIHYLIISTVMFLGLFFGGMFFFPYARMRIENLLNYSNDIMGRGYQVHQSLIAIGSGKFWGVGLGEGKQKFLFLPELHTDFIFANIAEEVGFIGSSLVMVLFILLLARGVKIALSAECRFGELAAIGIISTIFVQAMIHIGVTVGIFPTTGLPLPMISFGGSSLVASLFGIGVVLSISRNGYEKRFDSEWRNRRAHLSRTGYRRSVRL